MDYEKIASKLKAGWIAAHNEFPCTENDGKTTAGFNFELNHVGAIDEVANAVRAQSVKSNCEGISADAELVRHVESVMKIWPGLNNVDSSWLGDTNGDYLTEWARSIVLRNLKPAEELLGALTNYLNDTPWTSRYWKGSSFSKWSDRPNFDDADPKVRSEAEALDNLIKTAPDLSSADEARKAEASLSKIKSDGWWFEIGRRFVDTNIALTIVVCEDAQHAKGHIEDAILALKEWELDSALDCIMQAESLEAWYGPTTHTGGLLTLCEEMIPD